MARPSGSGLDAAAQFRGLRHQLVILLIKILEARQAALQLLQQVEGVGVAPSARKDDASPFRPFQPPGGRMEPIDASLQRGRQG